MAQLQTNPYDPMFLTLCANPLALQWAAANFRAEDDRFWSRLGYLLGTRWDRSMVEQQDDADVAANPNTLSIPLAQAIRPELFAEVKKAFAQKTVAQQTKAEPQRSRVKTTEMASLAKDAFMRLLGGARGGAAKDRKQQQVSEAVQAAREAKEKIERSAR